MAQRTSGVFAVLSLPKIYSFAQNLIARPHGRGVFVAEYLRPRAGDRVLDIGCGPGDLLAQLPDVDYHGYDLSPAYIEAARARHGDRGHFACAGVADLPPQQAGSFDLAIATGVLHHLDDNDARALFAAAAAALKPGGRLVTLDCAFRPGQNPIARLLAALDRGKNVRAPEAYVALARTAFTKVEAHIREDLMRVPYTHFMMECTRGA